MTTYRLRLLWAAHLTFTARRLHRKAERLSARARTCTDMALEQVRKAAG